MTRDDDDRDDDDAPGDRPGPGEQSRAEAFGRWVDGLMAGEPLPPAMDSDDRAMVEAATVVMASSHAVELSPERTRKLVDQALEAAVLGRTHAPRSPVADLPATTSQDAPRVAITTQLPVTRGRGAEPAAASSATDLRVTRRRIDRVVRTVPWVVAITAAAAAVIFFLVRPGAREREVAEKPRAEVRLSVSNTSRPADPLVGVIERGAAGGARERIDIIFADRMDGYRDLRLRRAMAEDAP
jgi:hypothetical protein